MYDTIWDLSTAPEALLYYNRCVCILPTNGLVSLTFVGCERDILFAITFEFVIYGKTNCDWINAFVNLVLISSY